MRDLDRQYYLDLAASGRRMPIGADLVLREHADHDAIVLDGARLGAVVAEAAERFDTPLAIPLMDLAVEKSQLLEALGVPEAQRDTFHLTAPLTDAELVSIEERCSSHPVPRLRANIEAAAKGPLPADVVEEAKRRLDAAGSSPA